MPSLEDAASIVLGLPEVEEGVRWNHRTWGVRGKVFAWERPFSKADLKRFAAQTPPAGPILAIAVGDLGEKEAVLSANDDSFFTIAHFEGYPAVLVALDDVAPDALREALLDAWLTCAPAELADAYRRDEE